ncbi:hypothetical protein P4O66_003475 [Electrophorus voltai]|uniref:Solute carrier family 25 member 17 n=1 Tax=Electrophorus voltai TaxID=2609070 RepID=A0AAD8YQ62_9TELE|nr:hypothetical protein P4O66_003475 [Electrophorus voltai]
MPDDVIVIVPVSDKALRKFIRCSSRGFMFFKNMKSCKQVVKLMEKIKTLVAINGRKYCTTVLYLHSERKGSMTAMTVFFPLDTARLRLQVDEQRKARSTPAVLAEIVKEEGLLAPYRGWFPVICSLCCSNFVYFYCFHSLKATWLRGQRSTPGKDLIIGIVAVPRQMQHWEFVGYRSPATLLHCPLCILQLSSAEAFLIGAVAKAVATTVTYPLQTVQSILRFGQHRQPTEQSKLLNSLRSVTYLLINRVRRSGVQGLFKGLEAKLLQTVLTAALMFLLYEKITAATFRAMGVKQRVPSH